LPLVVPSFTDEGQLSAKFAAPVIPGLGGAPRSRCASSAGDKKLPWLMIRTPDRIRSALRPTC
jgi:hypothetical protein